jgi:aldehyde dehydrogenase (NAD+)
MNISTIAQDLRSEIRLQGHLSPELRKKKIAHLKEVILKHEVLINKALKDDLGKSVFESYATEIGFILDEISYILKHFDQWVKPKKVKTPLPLLPGKSIIYSEPYGVVLIISPWNYPFQLCLSPLLGAIAAGNKVVIKPSEFAPHTTTAIRKILNEVFTDKEVCLIDGGVNETQDLLAQNFDYIFFTGSTAVGKIVMKAAAENLTPVTLELGGKSPCLIEESADIDLAAKRCAWGKFINAGQTCVAPDYALVPEHLQEKFIQKIKSYIQSFYGENIKNSQDYPRIINEKHFERLKDLIITHKVAVGGDFHREDKFLAPTIMRDVNWDDKIMQDEIFGPILPVLPYKDLHEAIDKIISFPKPLAFYVFTRNEKRKAEILSRVPFGGGCVNDTVIHLANPNLPFGGVGTSGIGSYHGKKSFDTFSHSKSVFEQKLKVDIPLRYPPYDGKLSWLKFFIR